ncbi:hypothetical protein M1K46_07240 [Fictibacillus sp. WQ 8-8]|uniref:hypothetical protein n=1 Tax=unclassified Fictibacillus TaxID=2644029 RepID=UPI0006A77253|nr:MULTISPECIES: hypothetical protein [unclassified Fictibacillus]MCQ6265456.1 hypothetical protein [Fictibacillus sp. WQ 8-8]MED2973641.1 hypothetical protein [Fictibacillus sp. B-59209]UZJ77461.1 hypothetical protein OKX00_14920 [Fictibacillus sp. KU28468]SFE05645.1 hypothetical protein SAMN05428981_103266 [Bacillus sp. OV194]
MLYGDERDRILVDKYIMYPMLLTIFNRDLKVIAVSPFKLRQPYVTLIENVMNAISFELRDVKKEMMARKIKVTDGRPVDDITEYQIFIRGYQEVMRFPNVHLRNKAELLMKHFLFGTMIERK